MPRYEYVCGHCHNVTEIQKSVADLDNEEFCKCPLADVDDHLPMERLISKNTFHLKGGGWYSDGY